MRINNKGLTVQAGENKLFGVDFRDFIQKEGSGPIVELASEFGVSQTEVRKIKKQLERS